MKFQAIELPGVKFTGPKILLLALASLFFIAIPLYLNYSSTSPLLPSPQSDITSSGLIGIEPKGENNTSTTTLKSIEPKGKVCDIFRGNWVPYPNGTYYTNTSCNLIIDQQNCMKFGRSDTEFLKWRWKPDDCELPFFDAVQFLEIVRGKSLAFVGDSVGRNQMHSLLCLLNSVAYPEDISHHYYSYTSYNFKRYLYKDYNFTVGTLWSPFLVKAKEADPKIYSNSKDLMNLYLDEADEAWATEVENFDYVIVSGGHWFFRPVIYYENGEIVGCSRCQHDNITDLTVFYGHKKAFRTFFRTLEELENYKGVTFLRTFSPAHFENLSWKEGGQCPRTRPYGKEEKKLDGFILEMKLNQVGVLREAEKKAIRKEKKKKKNKKRLELRVLDLTEAMLLRPDGHPNFYGYSPTRNMSIADCVHWCLPGPIDTWNEFLLYVLKTPQITHLHLHGKAIE
ncbi:protein trichome birefringence-like 19 [Ziziphus jujuba]|uniref:Protein trichome birefringence-like 19 n=1 Tax=Ziziphus jujuba TaxID=326968 RepID=A0A6P4A3H7_ZIZJJ|nr:protein trichome birefringence-like 19 [Ziziphus jujuba]